MCTFRASCYSTRLSWDVIRLVVSSRRLEVSEKDEGAVALLTPIHWVFKNVVCVGAGISPAH